MESEEDHLAFLGSRLLGSLTDLPQEGKPYGVVTASSSAPASRTVVMERVQQGNGTTAMYSAFDSEPEFRSSWSTLFSSDALLLKSS